MHASRKYQPVPEVRGKLHLVVQLDHATLSICEAAHVQHQDPWQSQKLDLLLGCDWCTGVSSLVVCTIPQQCYMSILDGPALLCCRSVVRRRVC